MRLEAIPGSVLVWPVLGLEIRKKIGLIELVAPKLFFVEEADMDQVLIQLVMDAQGELSVEYLADLVPTGGWFTLELSSCYGQGQWKN